MSGVNEGLRVVGKIAVMLSLGLLLVPAGARAKSKAPATAQVTNKTSAELSLSIKNQNCADDESIDGSKLKKDESTVVRWTAKISSNKLKSIKNDRENGAAIGDAAGGVTGSGGVMEDGGAAVAGGSSAAYNGTKDAFEGKKTCKSSMVKLNVDVLHPEKGWKGSFDLKTKYNGDGFHCEVSDRKAAGKDRLWVKTIQPVGEQTGICEVHQK